MKALKEPLNGEELMEIVDRDEFIKCPIGTIFGYYDSNLCYGLYIKQGDELEDGKIVGYNQKSIIPMYEIHWGDDMEVVWEGIRLGSTNPEYYRTFPDGQKYLIFENEDVSYLKDMI